MPDATATPTDQDEHPPVARRAVARVLGALGVIGAIAGSLFFLVLFLTFASWKAAVAAEVAVAGAAAVVWKRRLLAPWLRYVVIAAILLTAIATATVLRTTWATQADHDARLSGMVSELCDVEVPAEAAVEDCGGSISNTGNGNSCRYLATATVAGDADPDTVVATLEGEGFRPTELDVWDDPIEDGRAYLVDSDDIRLFLQSSYQDDEGDLRCT
jgi:hypothetical protein